MSNATTTAPVPVPEVHTRPTTFGRVLHSEWIKARTLRSTWITAAAILLVVVGFGVLSALAAGGDITTDHGARGPLGAGTDPVSTVLAGTELAVLVTAVFGSVFGAREFGTGMIRTTFSAVPSRLPVLWGKLLGFSAVVLPAAVVGVLVAFFLGMAVLDGSGSATMAWGDDGVARSVLGTAYYITGLGLIGLALGVILRGTAAAIGTVVGAVLIIPSLATVLLPDSWSEMLKYLPSNAGSAFTDLTASDTLLSAGVGAVVFTAWIGVAVAGAALTVLRRDA